MRRFKMEMLAAAVLASAGAFGGACGGETVTNGPAVAATASVAASPTAPGVKAGCNPDFQDCTVVHSTLDVTFVYDGPEKGTIEAALYTKPIVDKDNLAQYGRDRGVTKFPYTYTFKNPRPGNLYVTGFLDVCDNSFSPHPFDPVAQALVPVTMPETGGGSVTVHLAKSPQAKVDCSPGASH